MFYWAFFMFQADQKRKKQKEKETIFRDSSRLAKICSYVAQTFPSDGAVMSFGLHKQGRQWRNVLCAER